METLSVRCFGRFELRIDGKRVDLWSIRPRARATLRLLALNADRPVHREVLMASLWPDSTPVAATRSLHVALSSLRNLLEVGTCQLLRRDGDAYLLDVPRSGEVDVARFNAALATARRARQAGDHRSRMAALHLALDAYTGELLPEDGPAEWVVGPREQLRHQAATAAAELASAALTAGEVPLAIAMARRCLVVDSFHDDGWRILIAAHGRLGEPAAAERARRAYAHVLSSLGLDPAGASRPGTATLVTAHGAADLVGAHGVAGAVRT